MFRYKVTRADGIQQTVSHNNNPSSSRISTAWDGLSSCKTYRFAVQCKIQGEDCQGDPYTFTAATSCYGLYILLD